MLPDSAYARPVVVIEAGAANARRSKAQTLAWLRGKVRCSTVLPQFSFTCERWGASPGEVLTEISKLEWADRPLAVHSSAMSEDRPGESLAGHFDTVLKVNGAVDLQRAIKQVAASMKGASYEVFIPPMVRSVVRSGVAFSQNPNTGAAYYVLNYDNGGSTSSVTSGEAGDMATYYHARCFGGEAPLEVRKVLAMVAELESTFGAGALDIEFAETKSGEVFLLQARRLSTAANLSVDPTRHAQSLSDIASKVDSLSRPHHDLCGDSAIFGIMPDWNPAEMIGVPPRPLAYGQTRSVCLPPLIRNPEDVYSFFYPATEPNYITQQTVVGVVTPIEDADLEGAVVFVEGADPGFDWIFCRKIAGFVTKYGGVNSHMAIRAGELGVPAVIGAAFCEDRTVLRKQVGTSDSMTGTA